MPHCCRDKNASGMVSYPRAEGEEPDHCCGEVARFRVPSRFESVPDCWYCADCWDYFVAWNQMQHEKYGVPLVEL